MNLSKKNIESLKRLIEGEYIPSSSLKKELADLLIDEGLLFVTRHGSRCTYCSVKTSSLKKYLSNTYEIFRDIDNVIPIIKKDELTRSSQAKSSGNSKIISTRSCPGFPVNSVQNIPCILNGNEFNINPQVGSFLFVYDWKSLTIPEDVVIVGIENMENFIQINNQRSFIFDYIKSFYSLSDDFRVLFVSRYPQSLDLRHWLMSVKNKYLHFGDFDLAGISIFLTEFHRYLGDRASFLIPDDIETRIAFGSEKRYNDQYTRFKDIKSDIIEIQQLIDLINFHHKAYDQEGYISL